jgi:SPOR domain
MNKSSLKKLVISFACALICSNAQAETVFMLQLGSFDSEKKATNHWNNLVKTFPELFDEVKYAPSEIVNSPDNFISYRTQAGPIPTRDAAENICGELISSGYECGVSETAMFYGDSEEIAQSGQAKPLVVDSAPAQSSPTSPPLPVAAPKVETPAPAPIKAPAPDMPAIVPFAPQEAQAPAAAPFKTQSQIPSNNALPSQLIPDAPVASNVQQGMIAAEEAIPVPLSNDAPIANPYLERDNRLANAHPNDASRINSFWADIGYFNNEIAAAQYVRTLKARDPLLPPNLRIRITRPYGIVTGRDQLSLRVGPFVTTRPILRLCVLTRQDNMRCRAVKDLGGSIRNTDRYSLRRNYNERRSVNRNYSFNSRGYNSRGVINGERGYNRVASTAGGAYSPQNNDLNSAHFVQLGSFLSPDAATAKWQQLKGRHGYVLQNVNNDIVLPRQGSGASRLFRLRAGPFVDGNAAYNFCNQLKAGGTLCIVTR